MGQTLGRNCVSCCLRSSSEEMKHFGLLCFQSIKQRKIFFLEKMWGKWNLFKIFFMCIYKYYMFVRSTV